MYTTTPYQPLCPASHPTSSISFRSARITSGSPYTDDIGAIPIDPSSAPLDRAHACVQDLQAPPPESDQRVLQETWAGLPREEERTSPALTEDDGHP